MTGGGIVPHGEDITYTITAPADHPLGRMTARESYQTIHATIARWLAAHGKPAELAGAAADRGNGVCFESPVEADVLASGQKLAGAAQRRTKEGLLIQGSIQGVPLAWADDLPEFFECTTSRPFSSEELQLAARLSEEKYGTESWTKRL